MISEHLGGIKKNKDGDLEIYKTEPPEDVSAAFLILRTKECHQRDPCVCVLTCWYSMSCGALRRTSLWSIALHVSVEYKELSGFHALFWRTNIHNVVRTLHE
jgi:hypothetical protein